MSLAIVDPITLQIELIWLPNFFASKSASSVSLVSPDCETPMVRVFLEQTDLAGNSLAMKASDLKLVNCLM